MKCWQGGFSLKASPLGLRMATLFLYPHMIFSPCAHPSDISLHVQISSSFKDNSQIGLGPIPNSLILTLSPLKKPCVQMQSYFEALGVRTSTGKLGEGRQNYPIIVNFFTFLTPFSRMLARTHLLSLGSIPSIFWELAVNL